MELICAPATPAGAGAIAVIRLAGEGAVAVADTLFRTPSGKRLADALPNTVHYGEIVAPDGSVLDHALATLFRAPHSHTGDDTVEFSCHASPYVRRQLIELLLRCGARLAEPGEFTRRAFLRGKTDLVEAEAVADLIASTTAAEHRLAMNQMRGGFSAELSRLRDALVDITALLELELDFGDEDVAFADRSHLARLAADIAARLARLADSFATGQAIRDGIPVAIIGAPNAGKSTLLNLLLSEERAIVSPLPGTTRDTVEDTLTLRGLTFRLIDTAGLRTAADSLEALGITRTRAAIARAAILLHVIDAADGDAAGADAFAAALSDAAVEAAAIPALADPDAFGNKPRIVLLNKTDLLAPAALRTVMDAAAVLPALAVLPFSALSNPDLTSLHDALYRAAGIPAIGEADVIVTNARHAEALRAAHAAAERVVAGLAASLTADLLTQDLRDVTHHLGLITGQITTGEILSTIFSRFCIGK
jgi:tRNA modification GTPase